jgi:MFS family permease
LKISMNENRIVLAVPLWMDLSSSIFYLAAPLAVIEMGGSPVELGLIGTLTAFFHMTFAHLGGRLSDRFGRRALIVAAPIIFSASCFLMIRVGQVRWVLVLAALNGFAFSIFWPSFQAWIADLQSGPGLARNIGTFNMSWTAGNIIGPGMAGVLFGLHSRVPFLLAGVLSFSLFFFLRASVGESQPRPEKKSAPLPAAADQPRAQMSFLYAIWVANFASWFILGNLRYQFPKLARDLGWAPHTIGLLMSCLALSLFLGFALLRSSDRWHFKELYLIGSQLMAAVALVMLRLVSHPLLVIPAFLLIGFSISLSYYSSLYYVVLLLKKKGKGTGLHESILGSGVVLGPLLGGVVAQSAGLRAPYLLCLGVLAAAVLVEMGFTRRKAGSDPVNPSGIGRFGPV